MQYFMGRLSPEPTGNHKQSLATAGKLPLPAGHVGMHGALPADEVVDAPAPMHWLGEAAVARMSFGDCLVHAALHLALTDALIAERMHISAGYMSRWMRGAAQAAAKRLVVFMRTTRSLAPLEWIAHEMGCELVHRNTHAARVQKLEAELAALRGLRAA